MSKVHDAWDRCVISNPAGFEKFICDGCNKEFYRHIGKGGVKIMTCGKTECQRKHNDNYAKKVYQDKKRQLLQEKEAKKID